MIVYTHDFSNFHEISHAISVQMSKYYNDVGKITLETPINDYNIATLKNDAVLYDAQKKIAYILKNVKIDTTSNRITANGYTTNYLLNERVIASSAAVKNIESGVYAVVNDNLRGMGRMRTADFKALEDETEITLYGGAILEQIMPVLAKAELGHDMLWNHRAKEHVFEVYKGVDRTTGNHAVVFSDEQGTARNLVINEDVSTFKNVAYIKSKFNDTEFVEIIGDATGDDRYETWLEITPSKEKDETEAQYREKVRTQGALELGKLMKRLSFNVIIDPSELGVMYNIGDLVSCVSKRFGVKFNARITGMKYKKDAKSETTEIVLGEPKLTAIGEVKVK